jgi:FAD:protein FMN transferase
VLRLALELEARSDAAFNACCAAALVARGLLPEPDDAQPSQASTLGEGIVLLDDHRIRVRRTPWIDLGGIAKGHAVDVAVDALRCAGVADGLVNAGGDLRAFGRQGTTVRVRDPRAPTQILPLAELTDMACATSAWSLSTPQSRGAHLVGSRGEVADNPPMSVTVFASSCALADALTKVVWLRGAQAASLLAACGAQALMHHEDGSSQRL